MLARQRCSAARCLVEREDPMLLAGLSVSVEDQQTVVVVSAPPSNGPSRRFLAQRGYVEVVRVLAEPGDGSQVETGEAGTREA